MKKSPFGSTQMTSYVLIWKKAAKNWAYDREQVQRRPHRLHDEKSDKWPQKYILRVQCKLLQLTLNKYSGSCLGFGPWNQWQNNLEQSQKYVSTGKSLPEALIFVSTNSQYDNRLFIELRVQHMKIPSSEHVLYTNCFLFLFWHSEQFMFTTCS